MGSHWREVILAVVVCCGGCGPDTVWSPKNPVHEYSRLVKVASRVPTPADACESKARTTIGDIGAYGDPNEVIGAMAEEAAEHGGTHYVVRGDERELNFVTAVYGTGNAAFATTTPNEKRQTWAVVYRCE